MCGIAGFIDFTQRSSSLNLEEMTNALTHRGPDGSGNQFFNEKSFQIALGHRRLSIIDLSIAGKQPMNFENFWITYNGEIYNFAEISKELIALNHEFVSATDTEVILHAFAEWGIKCVEKFIGMFAFVIYDTNKNEITCVRDRAGVKPFFYYYHNNLFLFASELKSFHKHPAFVKELNLDALAAYMQFGNVPGNYCIFNNCHKLKPGYYLKFTLNTKQISQQKYWDVYDHYNKPKLQLSLEEAKTQTETILKSAFDYRMVSDVPVGVFLSGGYDSTCVAALLQKNRTNKIKTFTVAVPDLGLNEAPFAKEIANYLGTDHHEFACTDNEAFDIIDDLPTNYDEPFADSSAIPTSLICKKAHEQVKVILSADGADEIFAGYNRYDFLMTYGNTLNQLPSTFRKGLSGLINIIPSQSIPFLRHRYNFSNRYQKLKGLLLDPSAENMLMSLTKLYNDSEIHQLLKTPTVALNTAYSSKSLLPHSYSALSYMMAIDYQTYLADDILQKVDRASMRVGLEAREPFLDHRIIEFVAQLPDNFKYHNKNKKFILKEIVHQYLPKQLMDRPKMGFAIPIEKWLLGNLREKVDYFINEKTIERQGIFNTKAALKIKNEFLKGKQENGVKLWYLLMFQMWYSKWME